jgi:dTDP-4-amino-4,6-dideoxygalactose transaminase
MIKQIPFFSLERQYKNNKKIFDHCVQKILESQKFIGGEFVQAFEKKFSKYTKATYAISCNSGTDALLLAIKALDLQKDTIVLTTPFSFISSSSEIVTMGAHPVFIDIDEKTYNIDPKKIKTWIEKNTIKHGDTLLHKTTGYTISGIIAVDIFGQCADYNKINDIAKQHNLWVVQDSCQSIGAIDAQNQSAGTQADISCFSFYPTKNLGAFGDGGCCTTNNETLATLLNQFKNHGRTTHYNYQRLGINSRMDAIQAEILHAKLDMIDNWNKKRKTIAHVYNETLSDIPFLKLPQEINGSHVYHQYCVQITNNAIHRDEFMQKLKDFGIGTNIYYPKSLNEIAFLNTEPRLAKECPIATNLTKTIIALPIWPELEMDEVAYVCQCVKEVANSLAPQIIGVSKPCEKLDF